MAKIKKFGSKGWTPERLGSLAGKTYVITGTTSGAGFEATRVFLSKGAKVVMLNRNSERSKAVIATMKKEFGNHIDITFVHMDLSKLDSVRKAAEELISKAPQIDALICNAAIAQIAKQEMTVDGFESQLGVNYLGHFLLCRLLFERIDDSKGRIVVVGSLAYKMGLKRIKFEDINFDQKYSPWDAYAQSKLALMMFAYELHRRVKRAGKHIQVQVCHPGASRTHLIKRDNIRLDVKILFTLLSPFIAQSAEKGAWPEVMCATEEELAVEKLYGPTKRGQLVGPIGECSLDNNVLNREEAAQLWTLSEEKTSQHWPI